MPTEFSYSNDLSLLILDIVQNSLKADARRVEIEISKDAFKTSLRISDNGRGIKKDKLDKLQAGHGLSNLFTAAKKRGGTFDITTEKGKTEITATFNGAIEFGDLCGTATALTVAEKDVEFIWILKSNGETARFSTLDIPYPRTYREIENYLNQEFNFIGGSQL
ncbi:MAG: sensor histidine kinase [Clostridia bacterium]|nr:sensor histidine kinase [Clostridia bacterium]